MSKKKSSLTQKTDKHTKYPVETDFFHEKILNSILVCNHKYRDSNIESTSGL